MGVVTVRVEEFAAVLVDAAGAVRHTSLPATRTLCRSFGRIALSSGLLDTTEVCIVRLDNGDTVETLTADEAPVVLQEAP